MTPSSESSRIWDQLRQHLDAVEQNQSRKSQAQLSARLVRRAQQLRQQIGSQEAAGNRVTILGFRLGEHRYGIPVEVILEIHSLEHFTPVPGTPNFIPGVVHWRGSVLALLDLMKLFELPETGLADLHAAIVVEIAGVRIALVAGVVEDLLSVPESSIQPPPQLPGGLPEDWIRGVHDENRLILNLQHLLTDRKLLDWRD